MQEITIQTLKPGDEHRLNELLELYIKVFGEPSYPKDTAYLSKLLKSENVLFFIAAKNSTVIGGLTAYLLPSIYGDYNELYIYDMAVSDEHQRQGIGSQLLDYVKAYCKGIQVRDIYVQADTPDIHARNFYKKNGGIEEDVRHYDFRVV